MWSTFFVGIACGVYILVGIAAICIRNILGWLFYRALLQKRPTILRSLLVVAIPMGIACGVYVQDVSCGVFILLCRRYLMWCDAGGKKKQWVFPEEYMYKMFDVEYVYY